MDRPHDDELLSAYLDDELSVEERAYVEQLLADRPEARRLLDELRGVRESLQTLPSYKLEPDFGAQVLQRAEREVLHGPKVARIVEDGDAIADRGISDEWYKQKRWRRPLLWSIVAVAAAVVLMFVDRTADRERYLAQHTPEAKTGPAAPPPPTAEAAKAKDEGYFSVMNALPATTPVAGVPADPVGPATEPSRELDRSAVGAFTLKGGNLAGMTQPTESLNAVQAPAAQVDMTPLVAENDYRRAESLIADYNDVRRKVTDERAAGRAFADRMQVQQLEGRWQSRQSAVGEPPLIVSCVVSSADAVEQGLAPVLRRQQIADLTPIRESQTVASYGIAANERRNAAGEVAQVRRADALADEQYVYVVAERRQLEATLAELRRRSDLFNEVRVEPAATTISSPVPAEAVAGAAGGAAPPPPKSAAAPAAAKSGLAVDEQAAADKKRDELRSDSALKAAVASQAPGSNGVGLGAVGQTAGPSAIQFSYVPQSLTPLSRSQRIVVAEFEGVAADRETSGDRRAGEKELLLKQADAPVVATPAAPTATEAVNRPTNTTPAKTQEAAAARDGLVRNRDADVAQQRRLEEPVQVMQQLRGTYAADLPPDFQEALFIVRVVSTQTGKSPSTGDAVESKPTPAAKPQATGKAD